jgi:hypothetical protein
MEQPSSGEPARRRERWDARRRRGALDHRVSECECLPKPVAAPARTSTAGASDKTSAWMASGDRMPSRERLDHGALAPSAVNDWII